RVFFFPSPLSFSLCPGAGGWSPLSSDRYQWLEVDLGGRTRITAVATQGRYGSSDWQTAYLLMFSDTGHNWKQYRQEGSIGAFAGNSNADSVVQHKLQHQVIARYVRLIPLNWNPNGRIGLRLETYGCPYNSDVLSFNGQSSLLYRLTPRPRQMSSESISLKFKTLKNSGILLHAEGQNGHSLTLELEKGKLQLLIRKGKSLSPDIRYLVTLGSLLDDQHWHHVAVEHHSNHLKLTVDKNTHLTAADILVLLYFIVSACLCALSPVQMILGAQQGFSYRSFYGCLENPVYNGLNLVDLAKQKDQRVTGNVTFSCSEPVFVAMTFTGPQSFLRLPRRIDQSSLGISVGLQFRTWNKAGLLLTFELPNREGRVWLYLSKARTHLQIHKSGRAPLELNAGSALNDGQWHSVDLISAGGRLTITVDGDEGASAHASPSFLITTGGHIFFGGCPAEENSQECLNPFKAFQGCVRLLTVDNRPLDLIKVQQRLIGNYSHLQIDMCGIIDRCSPSHCEHGGSCSQSWSTFHCNCSGTGYSGATCHSSIYEQSCEAYKHKGNISGYYYIDVDSSGPIKPQLLYCNMTEDNTWMVIHHNNTDLTRVQPSPEVNQHVVHFEYASDEEQLTAIISLSEHCEQEVAYHCRKSRLLTSPEGSPLSWWVGGPGVGQMHTHWGGAPPGSQQCACSLQDNCVDSRYHCNCDADSNEWTNDSGLLTHKETLPVRSLVLGDIRRHGSESTYKVGPLRCHGDKNVWNAAFFDKETSYLHFPTLHGELSADISFLFKTTSSSGVFLENLGIKDFIRIELNSSNEVLFSFDVGNGPLEVSVKAGSPLNDNRWHRIQAERNVKEASLRLDELPAVTQEAPADGHIHLQLNSQLFIGVSSSATENVSLSFRTSQSPALLLYVSSYHREYFAVLLNKLEVRYRLDSSKDAEILRSKVKNLADRQLHVVTISRLADVVSVQIDQNPKEDFNLTSGVEFNGIRSLVLGRVHDSEGLDLDLAQIASLGFTGCLSAVLFNSISPLKVALLHPKTSPVTVTGPLIQSICGFTSANLSHATETTHHLSGKRSGSVGTGQPLVNAIRSDSALIGGTVAATCFSVALPLSSIMRQKLQKHSSVTSLVS
uniref:Contactin associated protein like 3 n=1 Tax=Oreochromis aureus TaxID=47969 RepID=A0A668VDF5_OREAU